MTTIRELMNEMDEIDREYAKLQKLKGTVESRNELADSIITALIDFLDDLKTISGKYDKDFEVTVRCAISSLTLALNAFGIDETFRSLKLARAVKDEY